jgi:hypothetical protein
MAQPTTVAEYLAALDEPRRSEMAALHALITKALPKHPPAFGSGMIGYGSYHFKYPSGREGDWPIVGLSSRKQYISVYLMGSEDGVYIAEKHRTELPKASIGKSCVRFKRLADIDLKVLEKVIRLSAKAFAKA